MAESNAHKQDVSVTNRKAFHDYQVLDRMEAGIALAGAEVKSIRSGHISLTGAFVKFEQGEAWLHQATIEAYDHSSLFTPDPQRPRRLLLHRRETLRWRRETEQKGMSVIPLKVYFTRGKVKLQLGLCKGKTHADKRESLKTRTADRETRRMMAQTRRR